MEKEYFESFRNILRRVKADSNREKYQAICSRTQSDDEERIWYLCKAFWPELRIWENINIDKYVPNASLDEAKAEEYICEIHNLLDKLGWKRI